MLEGSSRSLIAGVLLVVLAGCDRQSPSNEQATPAAAPSPVAAGKVDRSHKGEAAPTLGFQGPSGATTLAAFRGKPMLVNLWATWCAPCIKEMPTLDAAAADIAVVPISQDLEAAPVAAFFDQRKFMRLKPYRDPDTGFSVAYNATLPMSILFDSTGHEVWRSSGGMDWAGPQAKALLAEAR